MKTLRDVRERLQVIAETEATTGADSGYELMEMIAIIDGELAKTGKPQQPLFVETSAGSLVSDQEFEAAWEAFVGETSKHALRAALDYTLPAILARHVSAALRMSAQVVELFDEACSDDDYMIDAGDCASILEGLAQEARYVVANAKHHIEPAVLALDQVKVTPSQLTLLQTARDLGHALIRTGIRQRAGGAVFRAIERLSEQGLLSKEAPFRITEAGKAVLAAKERKSK